MLQLGSIATESVRLTLVQILLQKRGIKMNPVSTLYHIAPCCFLFLFLPFTYIELPKMMNDPNLNLNIPLLLLSAACAFGGSRQSSMAGPMGSRGQEQVQAPRGARWPVHTCGMPHVACQHTEWSSSR